jgi:hypothetical protein
MKRSPLWKILLCFAIFILFQAAVTAGVDRVVITDFYPGADAEGVPKGWELKEKSGQADVSVVEDYGIQALHLRSVNASFSVQKKVNVDVSRYPIISWNWKATKLPEGGDFRKSETDDQAAQLFLAFSRTKAIVYIWDTTAPEGLTGNGAAPFFMSIKVVVVRSGPESLGQWISETRNVYQDYKELFGEEEKSLKVSGIRLQINSQHTKSSAESFFGDVVFEKK